MNIFALHSDPAIAAAWHCDQHIHKMILETAQMLSAIARTKHPGHEHNKYLYQPTHKNHPCTKWIAESIDHLRWVVDLAAQLEYTRQVCHASAEHNSIAVIHTAVAILVPEEIEQDFWRMQARPNSFALAMPEAIKNNTAFPDAHSKYQEYYRMKNRQWKGQMTWKNRQKPEWM